MFLSIIKKRNKDLQELKYDNVFTYWKNHVFGLSSKVVIKNLGNDCYILSCKNARRESTYV